MHPSDIAADVRRQAEAWGAHPALTELVEMFDGTIPPDLGFSARLAWMDQFSSVWDYRGRARADADRVDSQDAAGAVRWLIPRLDLPAARLAGIESLTGELGLTGRHTNRLRVGYARELATGRRIAHVLAAASRSLMDSERDAAALCAPDKAYTMSTPRLEMVSEHRPLPSRSSARVTVPDVTAQSGVPGSAAKSTPGLEAPARGP
ncbi:MAG: hypothetical protein K2X97_06940 [Mycobacteriaceae bacterium]|nr:hypothetical protein [Mycobacteriaceae bacterium]